MYSHWFTFDFRLSTALQILIFLPLTLATISNQAFLLLSLLLTIHSFIHGTMILLWGSSALSFLQLPMHPFLLLLCFNIFSSVPPPWLISVADWWGTLLTISGPLFISMEGLSSLLVVQKLGQAGKRLVDRGEVYQFGMLIATAIAYVASAWWIVHARSIFLFWYYTWLTRSPLVLPNCCIITPIIYSARGRNNCLFIPDYYWFCAAPDKYYWVVRTGCLHRL